jgi:hypothetical protein
MLVAGPTQTTLYHQPEAQHLQQPMRMARSRLPHLSQIRSIGIFRAISPLWQGR